MATRYQTPGVQDLNMNWQLTTGNLLSRTDAIKSKTETFTYDNLNRLKTAQVNGLQSYATNFETNGNITNKSDAGVYQYDPNKIHALTQLNPLSPSTSFSNVSTGNQDVVYTKFQRPEKITENGHELTYTYGSDYERREAVLKTNGATVYARLYFGDYELTIRDGVYQYVHYITGGDGLCAIVVRNLPGTSPFDFYVPYTDHLGSILTVTDINGTVVAEQNFDAWGRKRNATTWDYANVAANPTWLYRGYTGHEHLPEFNLINMNARLYDPVLGRMLSPDNYVSVGGSQGMNRYTYANNNPLSYTDPDGNFWHIVIGAGIGGLVNGFMHIDKPGGFWKGFAIGAVAGALTAATGGLAAGYYATGTAAGAWAGATTGIYSSGVIGGLISGGAGAVVGSPVLGGGNYLVFGDPYSGKTFLRDVLISGGLGGLSGGIAAKIQGNNIWNNAPKAAGTTAWTSTSVNEKLLRQEGFIKLTNGQWIQVKGFGIGSGEGGQLIRDINPETISDFLANADIWNTNTDGYISQKVVQKYYEQMVDGSFVSVGRGVGGNLEGVARYAITEGNHRVTAAAWYGMKTGDYTHLQNLIKYGNWREGIFRGTKNAFARVWNP